MTSLEILALLGPVIAVEVVVAIVLLEIWLMDRAERRKGQ